MNPFFPLLFIRIPRNASHSIGKAIGIRERHKRLQDCDLSDKPFVFCVSRDPYTRIASCFNYFRKCKKSRTKHGMVAECVQSYENLESFCDGLLDFEFRDFVHFKTQSSWASINGSLKIDFQIRLERIDDDWSLLCNKIGINYTKLSKLNSSVGDRIIHPNVDKVYRDDFENFGYDNYFS